MVTVNGKTVTTLGTKVDPDNDSIKVDGKLLRLNAPKKYILLNKPRGTISSVTDDKHRETVVDIIAKKARNKYKEFKLFPVGRLDYDAEGVILLTNDGDLTNKLLHPKFKVEKTYEAKVKGRPAAETLAKLTKGVTLEDGKAKAENVMFLRPAKASRPARSSKSARSVKPVKSDKIDAPTAKKTIDKSGDNSWISLTLTVGKNRIVKRMFLKIGHPVQRLKRTSFAGLKLSNLKPGEFRELQDFEVERLKDLQGK